MTDFDNLCQTFYNISNEKKPSHSKPGYFAHICSQFQYFAEKEPKTYQIQWGSEWCSYEYCEDLNAMTHHF